MLSLSGPEAALLQERRIADCPDLVVECPDQIASEVNFVAHLNGVSPELVNWKWSVVGGSISRGQGTSAIVVHRLDMSSTTATVEVGGLPVRCESKASCTIFIEPVPRPRKVDEYYYRRCASTLRRPASMKRKTRRRRAESSSRPLFPPS